ncbi:MAG: UbiA prenyltransferase family protein [Hyphomicrobiales bacterium]
MKNIIQLIRMKSWVKNLLILTPLFFSMNFFHINLALLSISAMIIFSLACSCIYIINDTCDIEQDKIHPRKKHRPLASGAISIKFGISTIIIFLCIVIVASLFLSPLFGVLCLSYLILNVLYSFYLKHIAIIDITIIAVNFLIRILIGCVVINVYPSQWIVLVTFFLSLFLGFTKRKSELDILGENAIKHRKVLKEYSREALSGFKYISATITLISYIFYSINPVVIETFGSDKVIYSSFFVTIGLFRFIQLSESNNSEKEGDPTTLLMKDHFLQLILLIWVIYLGLIIYFGL